MLAIVLASVIFAIGGLMTSFAEGFTRLAPSLGVVVSFVLGSLLLSKAVQAEGLTIPYILGLGIESVATGCVHQRAECVRMCTQTTVVAGGAMPVGRSGVFCGGPTGCVHSAA